MKIEFKEFRGTFTTWNALFQKAAEFGSTLSPDRLISISHCSDHSEGVVTVWYWSG